MADPSSVPHPCHTLSFVADKHNQYVFSRNLLKAPGKYLKASDCRTVTIAVVCQYLLRSLEYPLSYRCKTTNRSRSQFSAFKTLLRNSLVHCNRSPFIVSSCSRCE